jgi:hypothetical protein
VSGTGSVGNTFFGGRLGLRRLIVRFIRSPLFNCFLTDVLAFWAQKSNDFNGALRVVTLMTLRPF